MRFLRFGTAMILTAVLVMAVAFALGEGAGISPEINTEYKTDLYPYVVHTASADWHIAKADIERSSLDELWVELSALIEDQEADFADARTALSGYLCEPVPKVRILTDFCEHAEAAKVGAACYNSRGNFIKLFRDWFHVRASLLHEYVHYLTFHCTDVVIRAGFWAEGIADYISVLACRNRLACSVNMGLDAELVKYWKEQGVWDPEYDCVQSTVYYYGMAEAYRAGVMDGTTYFAVSNTDVRRAEGFARNPRADDLTFKEAACMMVFLIETYGKDTVFLNWNRDPENMQDVFGMSFPELYEAWASWNTRKCEEMHIVLK